MASDNLSGVFLRQALGSKRLRRYFESAERQDTSDRGRKETRPCEDQPTSTDYTSLIASAECLHMTVV
jgi:hypothetical protein